MIKECAIQFKKLTNYHFKIVISKNKQQKNIKIDFCESDFIHIAGIHKLKDTSHLIRGSKSSVFNRILVNDALCAKLEKSIYYKDILFRLELCNDLKDILINKFDIFSYKKTLIPFLK